MIFCLRNSESDNAVLMTGVQDKYTLNFLVITPGFREKDTNMTLSKICHVGIQINRFKEKSLLFFKTIFTKILERCLWFHQYETRHNKLKID